MPDSCLPPREPHELGALMALCTVTVPALCTEPGTFSGLIHSYQVTTSFSAQLSCWLLLRKLVSRFLSWVCILCVCMFICVHTCVYMCPLDVKLLGGQTAFIRVCVCGAGSSPIVGLSRVKAPICNVSFLQGPSVSQSTALSWDSGAIAGAASSLDQWDSEQ